MRIEGLTKLKSTVHRMRARAQNERRVEVRAGYTAAYAVHVHEIDKNYRVGGFKYLERPAREMHQELKRVITEVYRETKSLNQGLLVAGLRLINESVELVPVDTGNLKASWFVRSSKTGVSASGPTAIL